MLDGGVVVVVFVVCAEYLRKINKVLKEFNC